MLWSGKASPNPRPTGPSGRASKGGELKDQEILYSLILNKQ